jgi:hypothetical protein
MTLIDWTAADWEEIRHQLAELEKTLVPFRVPTPTDLKQYELSVLTKGQIKSAWKARIDHGDWVYAREGDRREQLESLAFRLGFPSDFGSELPNHLRPAPVNWDLIRGSIHAEQASSEFILAWGELNQLAGRYIELIYNSKHIEDQIEAGVSGKRDGSLVQKYWFAYWIQANSKSLLPKARASAESELAKVCLRIHERELKPHEPYPIKWFRSMLEEEEVRPRVFEPGESLNTTYTRLTVKALKKLLADPMITSAVLPPLRAAEFQRR